MQFAKKAKARFVVLTLAVGLGSTAGCSVLFPANDPQCSTDGDCRARGADFVTAVCANQICVPSDGGGSRDGAVSDAPVSEAWSCIGDGHTVDASRQPVTLTAPYVGLVNALPIPGVSVRPCDKLDVSCSSPLADAEVTDDAGVVRFTVAAGYDGYLETAWDAGPPAMVFINPPVVDSTPHRPTRLVDTTNFENIVGFVTKGLDGNHPIDPAMGHVFLYVSDCNKAPGVGVQFTFDRHGDETISAYLINNLPSTTATATDALGSFAILDVPPGPITVTAALQTTGQQIGIATGTVRAGTITYLAIVPSP